MAKPDIFLDSSALIAGAISETGAAHALFQLGESEDIHLTVSEMVIVESERSMARKVPHNLNDQSWQTLLKRKFKPTSISSKIRTMCRSCSRR